MGTYNGEYYENFTKSPKHSNKITTEKMVYNKLGPGKVETGINIAVIQNDIDNGKSNGMTIEEYLASIDKKYHIVYFVQD